MAKIGSICAVVCLLVASDAFAQVQASISGGVSRASIGSFDSAPTGKFAAPLVDAQLSVPVVAADDDAHGIVWVLYGGARVGRSDFGGNALRSDWQSAREYTLGTSVGWRVRRVTFGLIADLYSTIDKGSAKCPATQATCFGHFGKFSGMMSNGLSLGVSAKRVRIQAVYLTQGFLSSPSGTHAFDAPAPKGAGCGALPAPPCNRNAAPLPITAGRDIKVTLALLAGAHTAFKAEWRDSAIELDRFAYNSGGQFDYRAQTLTAGLVFFIF